VIDGSGQPLLANGHFLVLSEYLRISRNDRWLLAEVHHEGKHPQILEEPASTLGRPARTTSSPSGERALGVFV